MNMPVTDTPRADHIRQLMSDLVDTQTDMYDMYDELVELAADEVIRHLRITTAEQLDEESCESSAREIIWSFVFNNVADTPNAMAMICAMAIASSDVSDTLSDLSPSQRTMLSKYPEAWLIIRLIAMNALVSDVLDEVYDRFGKEGAGS